MINANECETRENSEKDIYQMHIDRFHQLAHDSYKMIKSDIEQMALIIRYPFAANKCTALDKQLIYSTVNRIEEHANHVAFICAIVKGACRVIPDELNKQED